VENTLDYAYGWSLKGTRCFAETLGHFTERVSMIAAWCQNEVFAPMTFTGYCDSRVVETWFEQVLVPTLKIGQTIILDNASFHRKATLQKLLEPLGCRVLALPPYSPDLNRIEPLWNQIKALIKHHPNPNRPFRDKVDDAFCSL
jgi:transposase